MSETDENKKFPKRKGVLLGILKTEILHAKNGIGKPLDQIKDVCEIYKKALDGFEERLTIVPSFKDNLYLLEDMNIHPAYKDRFSELVDDLFLNKIVTYREFFRYKPAENRLIVTTQPIHDMFAGKGIVVINKKKLREYANRLGKMIKNIDKKEIPTISFSDENQLSGTKKSIKTKPISTVKIEGDFLVFGFERIPITRGPKSITTLLLKNAEMHRKNKIFKKGTEIEIEKLIEIGNYKDSDAFRDGLKRLRSKIRGAKFPVTIENIGTGTYQMVIKYQ